MMSQIVFCSSRAMMARESVIFRNTQNELNGQEVVERVNCMARATRARKFMILNL